jgi:hypothetical protein
MKMKITMTKNDKKKKKKKNERPLVTPFILRGVPRGPMRR